MTQTLPEEKQAHGGTGNPYRMAFGLITRRVRWDLDYRSWVSRKRLRQLKDSQPGRKCVIMCNGPSLLGTDFELLKRSGIFAFGLNKINLLFDVTDFRPNCVVAVNRFVISQNAKFFNHTELPLFLGSYSKAEIRFRENVIFVHDAPIASFVRNCSISLNSGCTVTYVAMQLAFHMGFRHVALVGCDHNFASSGPAHATVTAEGNDRSHFDPRYFSGGMKWQLPDLAGSEFSYQLAGRAFDASGGEIVNCTVGGKLEVFRRCSLNDFLKQ
jgi:hypothetical protein